MPKKSSILFSPPDLSHLSLSLSLSLSFPPAPPRIRVSPTLPPPSLSRQLYPSTSSGKPLIIVARGGKLKACNCFYVQVACSIYEQVDLMLMLILVPSCSISMFISWVAKISIRFQTKRKRNSFSSENKRTFSY